MNNTVTEDYCSFKVSKLLKEKGFFQVTSNWFNKDGKKIYWTEIEGTFKESNLIPNPTHALAIKWIEENFGIYIWAQFSIHDNTKFTGLAADEEYFKEMGGRDLTGNKDTPQEAIEAALLYTLKNLIP